MSMSKLLSGGTVSCRAVLLYLCVWAMMVPGAIFAQISSGGGPTVIKNPEVLPPSIPRIINVDLRDLPVARAWQPGDAIKEIPRRRTRNTEIKEKPEPQIDPLLELQANAGAGSFETVTAGLNFAGQGFTGVNPPDTVGDVGLNYYIQSINGSGGALYVVYNKADGSVAAGPFSMDSLGSGSCASGLGDPVILYDQQAGKWFISEFSGSSNTLCVYISQTSDPITGGWYNYAFNTTNFPDYPKYGVWSDAYYVGTNENTSRLYAFDRDSMLVGAPASAQSFNATNLSGFGFQMVTPADIDGDTAPPAGSPAYFMRHRDDEVHSGGTIAGQDQLQIYEFSVDWNTPANSSLTGPINIAVTEFDSSLCGLTSFACFPQPGTSTTLDPLREVVMFRLAYRNFGTHEALVGNLVTDVNGADHGGIRWFELRKVGAGAWSVHQEGTYAPDGLNRWMGGIAMDGSGNIGLGYNVGGTTRFPSLRYTGRLSGDALGVMTQGEFSIVEGTASNNSNRYGDYSSMSIDPVDDCTFWFTGMYNLSGSWTTRIASFSFDECGCTDPPAAPGGASATINGNNRIDVSWNSVAGATEYRVYRAEGACPQSAYSLITTTTGLTYADTAVSGGVTYAYVVTAYDAGAACESVFSNCDSATATGVCAVPPSFAGLESVTDLQQSACSLSLSWSAASLNCGTAVNYNVYRSTSSGFTPGAGNLIATCVSGTSYLDTDVSSGSTYYYVVRAEDNSGNGSGPCSGGNEDGNTAEFSGSPTGPETTVFSDDIESGAGAWATSALPADTGTAAWGIVTTDSNSPVSSWFCSDQSSVKDQVVAMAASVSIPAGAPGVLEFFHSYNTESTFDGGVLEYSTNGGGSWSDIGSGRITENGYNSTISTSYSSPIGGRSAWSGNSGGFLRTTVDLSDFAGQSIRFRWRMACDNSVAATGWWVDDVVIRTNGDCGGTGCSYAISPSSASHGSGGGSGSVSVTADAGCDWTAVSNDGWITVTSGASGSGNGSVGYSIAANGSTSGRSGTITIAGNTFTVNQDGLSCSYSINPTSASYDENGGSGSVAVTAGAGCAWTAVSNDGWITVTSGASGNGNGSVGYSVAANASTSARVGTITIAGNTFTVNQDGAPTGSWVTLTNDNFESGFGSFNDGGSDCRRSANDASFAHQGTYCIRLRDNSGVASSMFSDPLDLDGPGYSELRVQFWAYVVSFENNENFFVEYWNGSSWTVIADFVVDVDFTENGFFNPEVIIDSGSVNFVSNAQVRIRCDASGNNDRVYIDEVVVSAR